MSQTPFIARSHLVSLLALTQQALVLGVQFLVARRYGVQGVVDAWIAAQALPAVANTAISAVAGQLVMPALAEARQRGGTAAFQRTASELLGFFVVLGIGLGGLLALWPGPALSLVAPGLPEAGRSQAEGFLFLIALGLIPSGANALFAQAAASQQRFVAVAALGPLIPAVQLVAFLLAPPAEALTWMIASQSALGFVLVPLSAALAGHLRRDAFAAGSGAIRTLLTRSAPILLIVASSRVNQAVDTFFASSLPEGNLASLGYASRAVTITQAVLAAPIATVVFARLSSDAARLDWAAFSHGAGRATERGFFLSVGAAMLLIGLGPRGLALFFGPQLSAASVGVIAACLAALSGIVIFGVWGSILARVCLAAGRDTLALLLLGVVPMLLNVVLDGLVVGRFGVVGLAAVTSANALLGLPVVDWVLRRQGLTGRSPYGSLLRFLACAAPPALLIGLAPALPQAGFWSELVALFLLLAAGVSAYALLVQLFGGGLSRLVGDKE